MQEEDFVSFEGDDDLVDEEEAPVAPAASDAEPAAPAAAAAAAAPDQEEAAAPEEEEEEDILVIDPSDELMQKPAHSCELFVGGGAARPSILVYSHHHIYARQLVCFFVFSHHQCKTPKLPQSGGLKSSEHACLCGV